MNVMRMRIALALALVVLAASTLPAQQPTGAPMLPDPSQMSGIPLPVGDVPVGTVTVRLIKGSLSNPIVGHPVELQGVEPPLRATTNEAGRAEFTNLRPGTLVRALAVVDGARLESQEFAIPDSSGVRIMLVVTDSAAPGAAAGQVRTGAVILGDQSRFVLEFNDDGLSVFGLLQIENTADGPIATPEPLAFELPAGAGSPAILEGSAPQAVVEGNRVVVRGPFAPGPTLVQFAYSMPYSTGSLTFEQRMPAPLARLTVLAQKVGDMRVSSPQLSAFREIPAEGQLYIVAQGPAMRAGDAFTLTLTGLPHTPTWPRNLALALAVVILGAGAWASLPGAAQAATARRRRKLEERRDQLFGDLTLLEQRHRIGKVDAREYARRRREMVAALERIYAELDEEAAA